MQLFSRTALHFALAVILAALFVGMQGPDAGAHDNPSGTWNLVAEIGGNEIPFRLNLSVSERDASGHFFDGKRPNTPSSAGSFEGGNVHLEFSSYGATLEAKIENGKLAGNYGIGEKRINIHGTRSTNAVRYTPNAPDISGEWIIPLDGGKGEKAWRLILTQKQSYLEASILRIDGDTGTLDGGYFDGIFRVSHYAGERAGRLVITPQSDNTLKLVLSNSSGSQELMALRKAQADAIGAVPTESTAHTSVSNKQEPFNFAFKDLDGHLVANTDERFRGKVVLVDVMGSWCPKRHDSAPFLEALYRKYGKDGLEIIALDFEPGEFLTNPKRVQAFIRRYDLTYTFLLAGEPKEAVAKIPQASNLNAWPTTFFIGRDGLVKSVHVGFTSPGSGPRDVLTRAEFENEVVALLGIVRK